MMGKQYASFIRSVRILVVNVAAKRGKSIHDKRMLSRRFYAQGHARSKSRSARTWKLDKKCLNNENWLNAMHTNSTWECRTLTIWIIAWVASINDHPITRKRLSSVRVLHATLSVKCSIRYSKNYRELFVVVVRVYVIYEKCQQPCNSVNTTYVFEDRIRFFWK